MITGTPLRRVGQFLKADAEKKRAAGDAAGALARYGSILRLAHTLRVKSDDPMEVQTGRSLVSMAGGAFFTREARLKLPKAEPAQWVEKLCEAQAQAFSAYAQQHGQAELGAMAVAEAEAFVDARRQYKFASGKWQYIWSGRVQLVGTVTLLTAAGEAGALLAVLLVWVGAVLFRQGAVRSLRTAALLPGWLIGLSVLWAVALGGSYWRAMLLPPDLADETRHLYYLALAGITSVAALLWFAMLGASTYTRARETGDTAQRTASAAVTLVASLSAHLLFAALVILLMCLALWRDSQLSMQIINHGQMSVLGLR